MKFNPTHLVAALAASLTLAASLSAQTITGTEPVKIFIVTGESNTSGKGTISPVTTPGTLDYVYANDETGRYQFLKSGGSYVTRADVGIRNYVTIAGNTPPTPSVSNLTTGLGSTSGLIGPELGFGHVIGDAFENKVMIVKVGVDAATLAGSFCPPSSRIGEPEPLAPADKGFYYKEIIRLVNEAVTSLGATPYEIVGLGWHQGWNDRSVPAFVPLYEENMANFIKDIRNDLAIPSLPVVIASAAMDWNYGYSEVELAQLKMTDATAYPEFVGNVAVVDCRQPYDGLEFWQPAFDSPADQGFHWNRSGKSFLHVGMAMGDAMTSLVPIRTPYRTRANGGSGGVTLTWNNGTEIPTTVRVLRNGVEIAAAAPANPPTFLDAAAPLGVNSYELEFTMPVTPCPPLAISHHSDITNLQGGQRINGVRLTWESNLGYTGITVKRNGSVIAASLPGTTTTFTDSSPPAGTVTYSVEPDDAGATPTAIQVTVTAAPSGGALIYEPFDMTADTVLPGKVGGIGLDGKWDGGTAIQVTSTGLYTFGSLPVFGNRLVRTTSNGSCTIHIGDTLHEAGLMEPGAQLWFSFLSQNPNNGNIHPTLALGDDILSSHDKVGQGGNAIGAKLLSGNKVIGTFYSAGTQTAATATQATLTADEVVLVVGHITWGADATQPDTIEIYTPGTDLVLDTPQSVSAVVDQSKFKVLSMWGNGVAPNMDEIRFGDSYLDVIGQGTDTSGDLTPPTPSTMSFVTPPTATSTTAITMTATAASDANGVQYQFIETSDGAGGTDSGWQDSPVYTDTGLNPNTQYTYTVQARDKSVNNNPNTASSPASATTLPPDTNPPPTPGFSVAPTATSSNVITMTATTVTDPEGGSVEYLFTETSKSPGGTDSAWQSSPIYTDSGLNPNTQYTYTVKARDNSSPPNESAASAPASATTPASTVIGTQFWDGGGGDANWNTAANWGGDGLPLFTDGNTTATTTIYFGGTNAGGTAAGNVAATQTTANNDLTAGSIVESINFTNNGASGRTQAFTLQGNPITLGNGRTNEGITSTNWSSGGPIENVIQFDISLGTSGSGQNRLMSSGLNNHIKVEGVISGSSNFTLLHQGSGTTSLTNVNNSYLGATNIANGGVLEVTSLANGGSNSSIGASTNAATNLLFSNAFNNASKNILRYVGSTNASTNRLFQFGGNFTGTNSAIESSGAGTLSFTNTGAIASGFQKARNFYLGGTNTGDNTFAPSLSDFTEVTTFTKQGVGKWIITGTHTYTGSTTVSEGTLALIGGSTASPITVEPGATIGFTLGSPPSSSSSVNLTQGTVALTGTPAPGTGHRLMTATGGFIGTPTLETAILGYQLELRNGDTELWLAPAVSNSPFDSWAASGSGGAVTFGGDTNGDGVTDGLAFLLGAADPDANALALLPQSEETNGGLKLTFRLRNAATRGTATATLQWSSDLGIGDPWTANSAAVPDTTQTVSGLDFQISPNGTLNDIIVTIPSTEATNGKLFGRVSVTEN